MTCRITLHLNNLKKQINMKNIMKKQCKKFPLWRCKGLLSVVLSSLTAFAFAQSAEVCTGTPYTIASTVDASGASTYQWVENGQVISGASAATYEVPNNKTAGVYTYIRQAKSADCDEWQSSNEFTVTVFSCTFTPPSTVTGTTATFTDPRDGKKYKTVVMPDGKVWFAQNLNYTKNLILNTYTFEANGKLYNSTLVNGAPAIGSYWCPAAPGSTYSGDPITCNLVGALYTWETAMMVDGKYADESKTSSAWDESWVSDYYFATGAPGTTSNADRNNARGGDNVKGGGRGICPKGWHIPTAREWAVMLDKVDGDGQNTAFKDTYPAGLVGTDAGQKLMSSELYTQTPSPWDGRWPNITDCCTDDFSFAWRYVPPVDFRWPGVYHVVPASNIWGSTAANLRAAPIQQARGDKENITNANATRAQNNGVRCVCNHPVSL
jgi:uncharacterized protein (TIGR02145 family)